MMIKDKFKKIDQLKRIVAVCKKQNKKVVFTNGCFDILHFGHIKYLEQARLQGDRLIVAVNSDASVRRLKGSTRPIFSAKERATLVAACQCVDYVVIFKEETPFNLIKTLKPDVLVKGGDWRRQDIVGRDVVESYGGRVVCINFVKGYSTSSIIERIKKKK